MRSAAGLLGDLLMSARLRLAIYTLGARPLMERHSPVAVTGLSMALGTLVYVPVVWPRLRAVDWSRVSAWSLGLTIYSALFALCVAYTIWYVAVRRIGSARTSAYSNLIPVVAMVTRCCSWRAIEAAKGVGAAAVLAASRSPRWFENGLPPRSESPIPSPLTSGAFSTR